MFQGKERRAFTDECNFNFSLLWTRDWLPNDSLLLLLSAYILIFFGKGSASSRAQQDSKKEEIFLFKCLRIVISVVESEISINVSNNCDRNSVDTRWSDVPEEQVFFVFSSLAFLLFLSLVFACVACILSSRIHYNYVWWQNYDSRELLSHFECEPFQACDPEPERWYFCCHLLHIWQTFTLSNSSIGRNEMK